MIILSVVLLQCSANKSEGTSSSRDFSSYQYCSYDGKSLFNREMYEEDEPPDTIQLFLQDLLMAIGLPGNNIQIKQTFQSENAYAVYFQNEGIRAIFYYPEFFKRLSTDTKSNWSIKSVIAHELAHHLYGHTLSQDVNKELMELEADRASGYILQLAGAPLEDCVKAIELVGDSTSRDFYPNRFQRVKSIKAGWFDAECRIKREKCPDKYLVTIQQLLTKYYIDNEEPAPIYLTKNFFSELAIDSLRNFIDERIDLSKISKSDYHLQLILNFEDHSYFLKDSTIIKIEDESKFFAGTMMPAKPPYEFQLNLNNSRYFVDKNGFVWRQYPNNDKFSVGFIVKVKS